MKYEKNFKLKCYIKTTKKGFTLIELIVVIAIMLVLSSFLIPKFNGYRGRAEKLKVIDTGRQIYLTAMESFAENNGKLDSQKLSETSKELLGIDKLKISNLSENGFDISYDVDEKNYVLKVDKNNNNFIINTSGGDKIYSN